MQRLVSLDHGLWRQKDLFSHLTLLLIIWGTLGILHISSAFLMKVVNNKLILQSWAWNLEGPQGNDSSFHFYYGTNDIIKMCCCNKPWVWVIVLGGQHDHYPSWVRLLNGASLCHLGYTFCQWFLRPLRIYESSPTVMYVTTFWVSFLYWLLLGSFSGALWFSWEKMAI